ncbi:hypothetical protein XBKQ1_2920008 [Xenorhabdus bovienii str. kraussei Quebec]|uniref:Uncharacterized protein n=1 Tax=Xenorhabdus bovienii str. kraussei Quebec TaxID=1398203 RepID=A0A077P9S9_XENBV|nr:hypothetical protein XBKQ1_2920008 [Xenorhabdus bovienii str. kraussei Quebec]
MGSSRWLGSYLLDVLFGSETHSLFNLAGLQNTSDDLIMVLVLVLVLVMGMRLIVLPMFWLGALTCGANGRYEWFSVCLNSSSTGLKILRGWRVAYTVPNHFYDSRISRYKGQGEAVTSHPE